MEKEGRGGRGGRRGGGSSRGRLGIGIERRLDESRGRKKDVNKKGHTKSKRKKISLP